MIGAILAAIGPFLQTAGDLIAQAAEAKAEQHAQILVNLQAAAQKLLDALSGLQSSLSQNDASADALASQKP